MPEKLPFSVVFCSGADDGHPATNLEVGGRSVLKAWKKFALRHKDVSMFGSSAVAGEVDRDVLLLTLLRLPNASACSLNLT